MNAEKAPVENFQLECFCATKDYIVSKIKRECCIIF